MTTATGQPGGTGKFVVGEVYYSLYPDFCVPKNGYVARVDMWVFGGRDDRTGGLVFLPYNEGWTEDWVPLRGNRRYDPRPMEFVSREYLAWEEFVAAVPKYRNPGPAWGAS